MNRSRAVAAAALAAGAACVALVARAGADEPRVALTWSAPSGCPDEAAVRASVAQLLAGSSAAVEGRADVRRAGERWQVVVTMNGGERSLEADSCRALADATALIVAMAVDPARVAANRIARDAEAASQPTNPQSPDASTDAASPPPSTPTPPPTPPPTPTPTPTATPTPPSAPKPKTPSPQGPSFALSAGAALDLGTLPGPAFGPTLGFAWTPWRLRLELAGAYFPTSSGVVPQIPGAQVQFSLLTLALRGCYEARLGSFDLGPCIGGEGGIIQANPQGFSNGAVGQSGSAPLFALDGGLLGAWRFLPHWALFARGDVLVQTSRPAFEVNNPSSPPTIVWQWQPGVFTGRASLGVEVRF